MRRRRKSKKPERVCYYMHNGEQVCRKLKLTKERIQAGKLVPEFNPDDNFIKVTPEVIKVIKEDKTGTGKYPKVSIAPSMVEAQINLNKAGELYLKGRMRLIRNDILSDIYIYNPVCTAYRSYKKHKKVNKLTNGKLSKFIDRCRKMMHSSNNLKANIYGLLYIATLTGQRIGSRDKTAGAGVYEYINTDQLNKNGTFKKKKIFKHLIDTYALTSLRVGHVKLINGEKVLWEYKGKLGKLQHHEIIDNDIATFYLRFIRNKKPGDRIHAEGIYPQIMKAIKKDTGRYNIKDLRTAYCHKIMPLFKDKWIKINGIPKTNKEKRELIKYMCIKASEKLGNLPGEIRRSYADPSHLIL